MRAKLQDDDDKIELEGDGKDLPVTSRKDAECRLFRIYYFFI